jgi:hypothetical protein
MTLAMTMGVHDMTGESGCTRNLIVVYVSKCMYDEWSLSPFWPHSGRHEGMYFCSVWWCEGYLEGTY